MPSQVASRALVAGILLVLAPAAAFARPRSRESCEMPPGRCYLG